MCTRAIQFAGVLLATALTAGGAFAQDPIEQIVCEPLPPNEAAPIVVSLGEECPPGFIAVTELAPAATDDPFVIEPGDPSNTDGGSPN